MKLSHIKHKIAESIDLPLELRQWLKAAYIDDYDVINQTTIDVNGTIAWLGKTMPPPPTPLVINHVDGDFIWVTGDKAALTSAPDLAALLPKTISRNCTISGRGTNIPLKSSALPKCTGQGILKFDLGHEVDWMLEVTNDFTSTYQSYDVNVFMTGDIGLLQSPWNSDLLCTELDDTTTNFPSHINGYVNLFSANAPVTFSKIHQKIKHINGHVHIGGGGYMPMVSWYRVKGVKTIEVVSWDEAGDELDDPSPIFNDYKAKGMDAIEFQEALIDAGLSGYAK